MAEPLGSATQPVPSTPAARKWSERSRWHKAPTVATSEKNGCPVKKRCRSAVEDESQSTIILDHAENAYFSSAITLEDNQVPLPHLLHKTKHRIVVAEQRINKRLGCLIDTRSKINIISNNKFSRIFKVSAALRAKKRKKIGSINIFLEETHTGRIIRHSRVKTFGKISVSRTEELLQSYR